MSLCPRLEVAYLRDRAFNITGKWWSPAEQVGDGVTADCTQCVVRHMRRRSRKKSSAVSEAPSLVTVVVLNGSPSLERK